MKSKTFTKRLVLNKKTVVDLKGKEMKVVVGGEAPTRHCPSYTNWPFVCPFSYCGPECG
jgi:hypothetical protein